MLRELTLDGFRAFEHFELKGLGRVNLLVGANNSGKSSVLEAVHCLVAGGPSALWAAMERRGEVLRAVDMTAPEGEVRHLFHGHEIDVDSKFSVRAKIGAASEQFTATVVKRARQEPRQEPMQESLPTVVVPDIAVEPDLAGGLTLVARWDLTAGEKWTKLALSPDGNLLPPHFLPSHVAFFRSKGDRLVRFLTTAALERKAIVEMLDAVTLTPEEDTLLDALRLLEPQIQRIASVGASDRGVVVTLVGSPQRVPIGSLGDGIWRMLGIALCMVQSAGGVVLIDEIDTGLHYSVMRDLWKMIATTAQRLDVQVFATTHSRDCIEALAVIAHPDEAGSSEVSIQRIERGKTRAVAYDARDILMAAERGIEVR